MPDWSYHSLFKPLLFRLPAKAAESLTLRAIGTVACIPGGTRFIEFLGQMRPAPELRVNKNFSSPVGVGTGFDVDAASIEALSSFGVGFIEVGPITGKPVEGAVHRQEPTSAIVSDDKPINRGVQWYAEQLAQAPAHITLGLRFAHQDGTAFDSALSDLELMNERVGAAAEYIVLDSRWSLLSWSDDQLKQYLSWASDIFPRVLISVAPDVSGQSLERLINIATASGAAGFVISGGVKQGEGKRIYGRPTKNAARNTVKRTRELAPDAIIIGSGGIIEPDDAAAMFQSGANFVQLYSGLIYAGPGLPKRINEYLVWRKYTRAMPRQDLSFPAIFKQGWIGFSCVGLGLLTTSVAAITVALTTVILPYDETFVGLQKEGFNAINANLLHFMEHDRVTYAGTSLSTGLLFAALAIFGVRTGQRWAYATMCSAALVGFSSFLLFLGFHYLDPLHAAVTLGLLPFFLWGVCAKPTFRPVGSPNRFNSRNWQNALYGQFWFVCIGIGLMLAGLTICGVGISTVFVPEDLAYMHTTAAQLLSAHPHLLPAIAHDRAGFGGALVTVGVAVFMTALCAFREGEAWVWWMLLIAGLPAFIATIAIHASIGYTNLWHLTPVFIAAAMFCAGLALSYHFFCTSGPTTKSKFDP